MLIKLDVLEIREYHKELEAMKDVEPLIDWDNEDKVYSDNEAKQIIKSLVNAFSHGRMAEALDEKAHFEIYTQEAIFNLQENPSQHEREYSVYLKNIANMSMLDYMRTRIFFEDIIINDQKY